MKKTVIILVSETSLPMAQKITQAYPGTVIYGKDKLPGVIPVDSFTATTKELFPEVDALIFFGALGICVRAIAPCLKNKMVDPAVVCIDSTGMHIIPVVSGHVGGANNLARELALLLGGEAVITTQSDNMGLWSLDTLGKKFDWNMTAYSPDRRHVLTECIATFVKQRPTALLLEIRDEGTEYMERTCPEHVKIFYRFADIPQEEFELLITVSPFHFEASVNILAYFPKVLHLGFGCRKDMQGDPKELFQEIGYAMMDHNISPMSLKDIATIDIKEDEPILRALAGPSLWNRPVIAYTADELEQIDVPNPSERVKEATQSHSVAEAAALKASGGGLLLLEKQKKSLGAGREFTIAVALDRAVRRQGHIEIVGAGPGDPELISVRGKYMLEKADLILYAGSLVPKELTFYAKEGATVRSSADMNLEEQFTLMKEFYDKGKFVVRLHTGDPCIYGAIQEQMAFFDQFGMSYHITPGISSFQAAAAALRSQFTIPEKVQTIILTRGEGRTPMPEKEQLRKLAASQSTMCIFLSAGIVEQVQEELLEHYPPETPVAACYKLTWKDERIYRGKLKDLASIVKENNLTLTTLLVIGEAIDNREGLSRLYADEFKHLFRP